MNSEERWVEIEEFPNYAVSDYGRVMNRKTARILSPIVSGSGYIYVRLYNVLGYKTISVHVLVASVFVDGWFDGAEVNHIDGDKINVLPENLEWCTHSENLLHAYATGLQQPTRRYKPVRCIETNEVFRSIDAAAEYFGTYQSNISAQLRGYRKTARGHTFELVN